MRVVGLILVALAAVLLPGCSTWRPIAPSPSSGSPYGTLPPQVRVVLRNDAAFIAHDARVERDSLFGIRGVMPQGRPGMFFNESTREPFAISMSTVRAIENRQADKGSTAGVVLVPLALLVLLGFASKDLLND